LSVHDCVAPVEAGWRPLSDLDVDDELHTFCLECAERGNLALG
jgi:hypothetical protein